MGDILEFLPRPLYEKHKAETPLQLPPEKPKSPFTAAELYGVLIQNAFELTDDFITYLKKHGTWTPRADKLMRGIIKDLSEICSDVAGVTHGTQEETGSGDTSVGNPGSTGDTGHTGSRPDPQ